MPVIFLKSHFFLQHTTITAGMIPAIQKLVKLLCPGRLSFLGLSNTGLTSTALQNILTTLFSLPSSSLNSNQNRSYSIPTLEMQSRYPYSFLTSDLCTRIIEEGNKRGIKVLLTHPDPQKSSRKKRRLSKKIDSQWVRDGNALGA